MLLDHFAEVLERSVVGRGHAAVSVEGDKVRVRLIGEPAKDDFAGVVRRAIIDDEHAVYEWVKALKDAGDRLRFVEGRHYGNELRARGLREFREPLNWYDRCHTLR
jgi:hypothetical protein